MAIYSSLKNLLRNRSKYRRQTLFSFFQSATPHPLFTSSIRSSLIFSVSELATSIHGPLFLSFPPWKLFLSATPLYLQCDSFSTTKSHSPCRSTFTVTGFEAAGDLPSDFRVITKEWYLSAFLGLVVSGATDWLDGYVARKMKVNSLVGSYLDPLADKVLIGSVALAMVHNDLLHAGLVSLIVFRDVGLVSAAFYQRASNLGWVWKSWSDYFNIDETSRHKIEPLFISKVNTVTQLVLVAAALLQPTIGTEDAKTFVTCLSWLAASTTLASTVAYVIRHMKNR